MEPLLVKQCSPSAPEICKASFNGDHDALEKLLGKGNSPNEKDETGYYPLHYAALGGNVDCLELLLSNEEVNVNQKTDNSEQYAAIHLAVRGNKNPFTTLKILKSHGADLTVVDSEDRTALHLACINMKQRVIELLLTKEAFSIKAWRDCNKSSQQHFPLDFAIEFENDEALDTLLTFASQNELTEMLKDNAVHFAMKASGYHNLRALKIFFQFQGKEFDELDRDRLLFQSLQEGHDDFTRFLVEQGCHPVPSRGDDDNSDFDVLVYGADSPMLATVATVVTPDIVETYNDQSNYEMREMPLYFHPLFSALDRIYHKCDDPLPNLTLLLELGFNPITPIVTRGVLSEDSERFLCPCGLELMQELLVGQSTTDKMYNIVSYAIFNVYIAEKLVEVVHKLLSFGASANTQFDGVISPLVALTMRDMSDWEEPLNSLLETLLNAGADLSYRTGDSSFACSDVAVTAALQGNDFVLAVVFQKTDLNPAEFLTDLKQVCYLPDNSDPELPERISELRDRIGHSVLTVLRCSTEKPTDIIAKLCEELDEQFEPTEQCGDAIDVGTVTSPWSKVPQELRYGPLFNLCRRSIRKHFLNIGEFRNINSHVMKLPLPTELQKSLVFDE